VKRAGMVASPTRREAASGNRADRLSGDAIYHAAAGGMQI
jgi:hypothetical protein